MNEQRFDPMTGQPLNPDSVSQQSANQQPVNQQPINQQNYGNPQTYGAQQPYGNQQMGAYGYDPKAIEKAQSDKNKKLAFVVLGVCAVLFIAVLGIGAFMCAKAFGKKLPDQDAEQNITAEVTEPETVEPEVVEPEVTEAEATEPVTDEASLEDGPQVEKLTEPTVEDFLGEDTDSTDSDDGASSGQDNPAANVPLDDPNNLFTVQLGDDFYHVPGKVSDFLDNGWTVEDNALNATLGYYETTYVDLWYGGDSNKSLSIIVANMDVNAQEVKDCIVTHISVSDSDAEYLGMDVKSHAGDIVVAKSTKEDVIAVLGEPHDSYEGSDTVYITYYTYPGTYTGPFVNYYFNENGILDLLVVENNNEPEDFAETAVSDEVPDYLSKYVAPTELGTDPLSGNFELDGEIYSLPVPYSEFEKNGWKFKEDPDSVAGANRIFSVYLEKGDMYISATACNPSDKATYLKYTMIIGVDYRPDYGDCGLQFPGGLSASMTEQELVSFMEKNGIDNYEYMRNVGSYEIPFDQTGNDRSQDNNYYTIFTSDGEITWFKVQSYGWIE